MCGERGRQASSFLGPLSSWGPGASGPGQASSGRLTSLPYPLNEQDRCLPAWAGELGQVSLVPEGEMVTKAAS